MKKLPGNREMWTKARAEALALLVVLPIVMGGLLQTVPVGVAAATTSQSAQGVTPTTIKVGITYPDVAAIKSIVNVDPGNYQKAYQALIDKINARGGINGRKIVPVFAAINPLGTAPAATACTELTEDDKVFVVMGFFQTPDTACYVQTHHTALNRRFVDRRSSLAGPSSMVQLRAFRQRSHPQGGVRLQAGRGLRRQEGRGGW